MARAGWRLCPAMALDWFGRDFGRRFTVGGNMIALSFNGFAEHPGRYTIDPALSGFVICHGLPMHSRQGSKPRLCEPSNCPERAHIVGTVEANMKRAVWHCRFLHPAP